MKYTVTRDGHVPVQLEADDYFPEDGMIVFVQRLTTEGAIRRLATFPQPCQVISEGIATVMPGGINNDEAQAARLFESLIAADVLRASLIDKTWTQLGWAQQRVYYRAARAVLNALSGIIPKPEE